MYMYGDKEQIQLLIMQNIKEDIMEEVLEKGHLITRQQEAVEQPTSQQRKDYYQALKQVYKMC